MAKTKNPKKKKPEPPREASFIQQDKKLYRMIPTNLGEFGLPFEASVPDSMTICKHNLPLIPLTLFYHVLCWQRHIAAKHSCESHTSLFLTKDGWVAEPFFQSNNKSSMTIDVDYLSKENEARYNELKEASINGIHATIHNHVNSGAGQSSVDVEDEKGLCGPHITLGNMNQAEISYHGRFSCMLNGEHHFVPMRLADIVQLPLPDLPSRKQIELAEKLVMADPEEIGWPKEWAKKFTIEESWTRRGQGTQHQGASAQKKTTQSTTTTTGSSSDQPKDVPIDISAIDADEAPWALVADCDTSDWLTFRQDIENGKADFAKPITAIMLQHGCSLYEIFLAASRLKIAA